MQTVVSKDSTAIAFEHSGRGPALILVDGSLVYRAFDQEGAKLARLLSEDFTVYRYDRRGRGESRDTEPYAVAREVEDIEALIEEAGGSAVLCGFSSGAVLALEAALALPDKVTKLAMYEPPLSDDTAARQAWKDYTTNLGQTLKEGREGDAIALFMKVTGAPDDLIEGMRGTPLWQTFEAVAPTLAYDHIALLGEEASVPIERAAGVVVPTLVMNGRLSFPFMHPTALALAEAIPHAQHRVLEGQTHEVTAEALAPVLVEFFKR